MSKESPKKSKSTKKTKELKVTVAEKFDPRIFEEPGMEGLFHTLLDRMAKLKKKEIENNSSEN